MRCNMNDEDENKRKLKILCLEDSPMDAQLIYEYLYKIPNTKFKWILYQEKKSTFRQ